jgi:hypothetical protein
MRAWVPLGVARPQALMKIRTKQRAAGTLFEYFLYVTLILETGLAASIYKMMSPEADLWRMRIYLGLFYFAFLSWGIFQLNRLHRKRKEFQGMAESEVMTTSMEMVADRGPEDDGPGSGMEGAEVSPAWFGLSVAQLMIVAVVFVTAVMAFSWVLSNMPMAKR